MDSFLSRLSRLSRLVNTAGVTVRVDPASQYQTVEGWGTSLAWWGHVVGGWSEPARTRIADLVFSPTAGLGLTLVRYNIGGGDDPSHHHMRLGGDVPGYQPSPGAWDWTADANQRWMLRAALARGATHVEAFSNSPPYWMTRSGCAAGASDRGDNLRDDCIDPFAAYLVEVVAHLHDTWGVAVHTIAPFNEPAAGHWVALNRQEGCHVSHDQERAVIARVGVLLAARGITGTAVSAADDFSIDQAVETFHAYDGATLARVAQLNTHSYSGTRRAELRALAARAGKRLWMSEYGTGVGHHDHAAMEPALALSAQIRRDMLDLRPSAWVYWQAVEHEHGHNHNWGLIHADFGGASESYWVTKQYFALGHYSQFIRPGYRIVGVDNANALAAYNPSSGTLVIVYDHSAGPDTPDTTVMLDLSRFRAIGLTAAYRASAYRTSPTENLARLGSEELAAEARSLTLTIHVPAQSITTVVVTGAVA